MTAAVALLRGINVGGNHRLPMDSLKAIAGTLGLKNVRTLIASGNLVFRAPHLGGLEAKLETAIEAAHGFRPPVILRTQAEWTAIIASQPFPPGCDPAKAVVTFLAAAPTAAQQEAVLAIPIGPEVLHLAGREMFIYFPNGQGRSQLPFAKIGRALGTTGTARNWNTVLKLQEMLDAAAKA